MLTLYAFSSENWRRSAEEISDLTALMRFYLDRELKTLEKEGVRLKLIGDYSAFGPELVERLENALERTAGNSRLTLVIALNYGSRAEIAAAARAVALKAVAGEIDAEAIDEQSIAGELQTRDAARIGLADPHVRARCGCPIFSCGRRLTPSFCSSTRSGPTLTSRPSPTRSSSSLRASAASVAGERTPRPHSHGVSC